jgi:hypothetical protein
VIVFRETLGGAGPQIAAAFTFGGGLSAGYRFE